MMVCTARIQALTLCLILCCTAGTWGGEWSFDDTLTLHFELRDAAPGEGGGKELVLGAAIPREVVERWTDEARAAFRGEAGSEQTPRARGYRVRIQVLRDGQPVAIRMVVPGTGPLADWLGVFSCITGESIVHKRAAAMQGIVRHGPGEAAADYKVLWYVNGRLTHVETIAAPATERPQVPPPAAEPRAKDVTVVAAPPTDQESGGIIRSVTLCRGVDDKGEPLAPGTVFPADTPVIAAVICHVLPGETSAVLRLTLLQGDKIRSRGRVTISGEGRFVMEYRGHKDSRFDPGEWRLRIELDGKLDREIPFTVQK